MNAISRVVVFRVNGQRYALPLSAVELVIRAVEVTPLPGAPPAVLGVIDMRGVVVPVFDMRRQLGWAARAVKPADQFVIARAARGPVALFIDEAESVSDCDGPAITACEDVTAGTGQFKGVLALDDGLVLIHDLERFLSLDDARLLEAAMERAE